MSQTKSLIVLSPSIPPQEVFINNGSFIPHKGLLEVYEYSYIIKPHPATNPKRIPLNNDFPLLITNLYWKNDNGLTFSVFINGNSRKVDLYDTNSDEDLIKVDSIVLDEKSDIQIANKGSSDLFLLFQAERISLFREPTLTV